MTDALGHTAQTEYDLRGRKIRATDALNRTTYYRYWPIGRLKEVEEANGAITQFAYDAVGNKTTMTNPLGKVWSYDYDANNQLITETDPLGNTTEDAYPSTGRLWIKRLPNGWITKNVYNGRRLMEVRSLYGMPLIIGDSHLFPSNRAARGHAYRDWQGQSGQSLFHAVITDPYGNKIAQTFDELGRVKEVKDALRKIGTVPIISSSPRPSTTPATCRDAPRSPRRLAATGRRSHGNYRRPPQRHD